LISKTVGEETKEFNVFMKYRPEMENLSYSPISGL
jgi:hypothetical protein